MQGRVAVHAVCPAAVVAAIQAGVDSIEHGWAITDSDFAAMRQKAQFAWSLPTRAAQRCGMHALASQLIDLVPPQKDDRS